MTNDNTFPKAEHLCGEIRISQLFSEGKAFIVYPLRIVYRVVDKSEIPVKVMFSVPKKRFKRAVKRNRLKRLMRETYRLNKKILTDTAIHHQLTIEMAVGYVSDELVDFETMQSKMVSALNKIAAKFQTKQTAENTGENEL